MNKSIMSFDKQINVLVIVLALIIVVTTTICCIIQVKNAVIKSEKGKIKEIVETAYNMVEYYGKKAESGEMSVAQAKAAAEQMIATYSYESGKNYVWINDYNNVMIYNPKRPVHSDCTDTKGPDGKYFYKDITQMARDGKEQFYFYKVVRKTKDGPKDGIIVDKISTARDYKPWGWVIATGVYLNDVNKIINSTIYIVIIVNILLLFLVILGVKFLFTNRIVGKLENIYEKIKASSVRVYDSTRELNKSSLYLAEGSGQQASSVQEISANVKETASMIARNDENTKYAAQLSKESQKFTQSSFEKMQVLMDAMNKINASSNEISKIIKVIEEIAFQTNILALNAAVEAARAGDAGKGFAVVAEEVRNLAQRSTESSNETTALIQNNIELCNNTNEIAKEVYSAIQEINSQTQKVDEIMQEIAVATHEQETGVEQIYDAISQVEQVIQGNAAAAQQTAKETNSMEQETVNLEDLLDSLSAIIK